jgi:hypothetical protein
MGESGVGDHRFSERDGSRSAAGRQCALVGPKTTDLVPM